MQHFHPKPSVSSQAKFGKKRGNYNCGRCGLPKKGHICTVSTPVTSSSATPCNSSLSVAASAPSSVSAARCPPLRPRRALSFDDEEPDGLDPSESTAVWPQGDDLDSSGLPGNVLWDVLKRLPPSGLLTAAKVSRGWRDMTKRLWKAAEELRLRVRASVQVGFVASMLQKCPGIVNLSLVMESDLDSTMLACIAFSCPNLTFLEISVSDSAVNRITGSELGRFVADKKSLKSLKMEGCSSLGGFVLCSSSLSTIWLSDLYSHSKMVFNCPQLREISLKFSHREKGSTDLATMVEGWGRSCPRLQNIRIYSVQLSHTAVLALTAAQLRGLRMLSLVSGSDVTDASVAAIASSYPNLELLDLSGSSVSDSGISMICNVFSETLTRLLLALCPNVTSSGIQFATAQLPHLEIMDCGMTICEPDSDNSIADENNHHKLQKTSITNVHLTNQKLIIKHSCLKKLSLWGCSGLDALYLNCTQLKDLNLNSCTNLHPERLLLQCPSLENVHASGCQDMLVGAIQSQVCNAFTDLENPSPCKRLPDGSKRVRVPHLVNTELADEETKRSRKKRRLCNVLLD
ncbi:F-box and leucine-rich repeat protein 2/20 [Vigna unguiculata]|uniref:F-box and leucine-rich repeat protein 2/20 n=1 Tax=Vigna unguiculata TaxID=3917 RepID=A0A4D6MD23_VIGUN|nr:F-box and leucine-rich repeat protein 2/20 [Vigna unguiculata]